MKAFLPVLFLMLCASPGAALAQPTDAPENPVVTSLKSLHDLTAANIMRTAEMLDDELYAYRPNEEVRTAGQILAHLANAQYLFCATAAGEESPNQTNFEETATTKADISAALQQAMDYCAGVYGNMTDEAGAQMRDLFGRQLAASAILAFNTTHNYEHYGNLVTYMRLNGLVPPSSM